MEAKVPPKIFISHSNGESAVGKLTASFKQQFTAQGVEVLLDTECLFPGSAWRESIYKWIDSCQAAVVILSARALAPECVWVPREVALLMKRKAKDPAFLVIPVLFPEVTPDMLRVHHQYRDLGLHDLQVLRHCDDDTTTQAILDTFARSRVVLKEAEGGPNNAALRKKLADLSQLAQQDAGSVNEAESTRGAGVKSLAALYIERTIEADLVRWIGQADGQAARLITVVGSAGHGKTSLLWNTWRRFQQDPTILPFLLKATWLYRIHGIDPVLTPTDLVDGLKGDGEKRKLVLIDTVDLLMHDEINRASFLTLIRELARNEVQIVVSTRPAENAKLIWDDQLGRRIDLHLGLYDAEEFPRAIERYSSHYYAHTNPTAAAGESLRLQQAVGNGRPLGTVCLNPLSLRMLFSLYAPHAISDDINVFRLYADYWEMRIVKDQRPGEGSANDTHDLSAAAAAVALAMLIEGTPELRTNQLTHFCQHLRVAPADIERLALRGVIVHTANGESSFFHQSFFEHAAGRALLTRAGPTPIALVHERMAKRPDDLFLMPAFEQLLLLALQGIGANRLAAAQAMRQMLDDSHPTFWSSALSVYSRADHADAATRALVCTLLSKGSESQSKRFLDLLPNFSATRIADASAALAVLWLAPSWRIKEHTVKLLLWLGARDWPSAEAFMDREQVIDGFLAIIPPQCSPNSLLLPLISLAAQHNPRWARQSLRQLAMHRQCNLGRLIAFALRNRQALGVARPANFFLAMARATPAFKKTLHALDHFLLADALAQQWQDAGVDPIALVAYAGKAEDWLYCARLQALAAFVNLNGPWAVEKALAIFPPPTLPAQQWIWMARFIMPLLARADAAVHATVTAWLRHQASDMFRNAASAALSCKLVFHPLQRGSLTIADYSTALSHAGTNPELLWLDKGKLGYVLLSGLRDDAQGAASAFATAKADPATYSDILDAVCAGLLTRTDLDGPFVARIGAECALAIGSIGIVNNLLNKGRVPSAQDFSTWISGLDALRKKALADPAQRERAAAAILWSRLVKDGVLAAPPAPLLVAQIRSEKLQATRNYYYALTAVASCADEAEVELCMQALLSRTDTAIATRRAVLSPLISLFDRLEGTMASWIVPVETLILESGADEHQVQHIGWVLQSLVRRSLVADAIALLRRVLVHRTVGDLSKTQMRTLCHHLSKPVEALVKRVALPERINLLTLSETLDPYMGRLLIDVLCRTSAAMLKPQFDRCLAGKALHDDLKLLIGNYRYFQERASAGEPWPELEAVVA